ncbi:unnamed protein product [Brassica oleracea var. botrytis]
MKSIMPSLKLPSFFMVMMNCLLQICQRKRLKGIISLLKTFFPSCFATAVEKVELKRGLLEQFTHEMEPLLGKQALLIKTLLRKMCTKIKVFPFRIRAELSMTQCRESLKPDKM